MSKITLGLTSGSIVVVSSVNGNRIFSNFGFTSYSCSKAAQVAFTKMAAVEAALETLAADPEQGQTVDGVAMDLVSPRVILDTP